MNENGALSGFLMSKLGIALASLILVSSLSTICTVFNRSTLRSEVDEVAQVVELNLRDVDSLPGRVRLERRLPAVERPYKIILTGRRRDYQVVNIHVRTLENLQRTIFLSREVNGGEFRIERANPGKIRITKSDQIYVELI